jgi:sugar phosphate permease
VPFRSPLVSSGGLPRLTDVLGLLFPVPWCVTPTNRPCIQSFLTYSDKQTINFASVFGLQQDLNVSGSEFSWAVSLFYFGILTAQFPMTYFIGRFPATVVVSIAVILWGACEMCLAAPHNAAGLLATRFFLGACEGVAAPGFVVITSNYYKRSEHPIRVAVWQGEYFTADMHACDTVLLTSPRHQRVCTDHWRRSHVRDRPV